MFLISNFIRRHFYYIDIITILHVHNISWCFEFKLVFWL